MPCGPKPRAFAGANPVAAAPKPTAALPILPFSAWYSGDCQVEPPPFALTAEAVTMNGEVVKEVTKETDFRLRVTCDRDVHFVLLMVWSNGEVVVQPTNKNGFLSAGKNFLFPKIEDPKQKAAFRITGILTGETKATEYFVLLASTKQIPAPVIVQSRHSDFPDCRKDRSFPIRRFLFDADFDPSLVVRRVVAVTVTDKKIE